MQLGRHRVALIALSFIVLVFVLVGRLVGDDGQREQTYEDLATFTEVLHLVDTSYVDPVAEGALMEGAFRGMLASLDPHSGWLSAEEATDMLAADPNRLSAGLETTKRSGYAYVVRILPDGPAAKAGVRVGEYIRTIDGRTTREMSDVQVRHLLTGPADKTIQLNLFGDHEGREVDLTLFAFDDRPVEATLDPAGVLVVTVQTVDPATAVDLKKLLSDPPEGTKHVLLDLRNVIRGDEADAVAVVDLFLDKGVIARVTERGQDERVLEATVGAVWKGPLAILVNQLSAAAAELITASLSHHERIEILGETTFGDASVQRLIRLPDQSALILSVGQYADAAGESWHREGLEPDVAISVELPEEEGEGEGEGEAQGEEETAADRESRGAAAAAQQLQRAVDYLAGRLPAEKAA